MRVLVLILTLVSSFAASPFVFRAGGSVPTVDPVSGNALIPDLISHHTLDQSSGSRTDSHSTNTFADNGSVTSFTGVITNAALFSSTDNSDYLEMVYNSKYSFTNNAFTITCWAYFGARSLEPNDMTVLSRGNISSTLSWWLFLDHGTPNDAMNFVYSTDGTFNPSNAATYTFSGEIGTGWNFIVVKWNGTTISISVTHNTELTRESYITKSFSGAFYNNNQTIRMGEIDGSNLHDMGGYIDEVYICARELSECSIDWLFSAKAGTFTYPIYNSSVCVSP